MTLPTYSQNHAKNDRPETADLTGFLALGYTVHISVVL